MAIESRQGEGCKLNVPVAIVDRLQANGFSAYGTAEAVPFQDRLLTPSKPSI
jgi:hypothetical protein